MRHIQQPQRTALAVLITAIWIPNTAWAAPLLLAQYPAGTAYKAPIPNVILSVDTSGSMSYCDVGDVAIGSSVWNQKSNNCFQHPTSNTDLRRITYAKKGLKSLLIDSDKYDGQFRLAWQSFACNNIPSNSGNCAGKNAMGKFSGNHRNNFGTWVENLTATGSTPSPVLLWNAGKYLETTGKDNPWNATPGTEDNAPLACRRSYHIFLTDGGWNYTYNAANVSGSLFEQDMLITTKETTRTSDNTTAPSQTAPTVTDDDNNILIRKYDGKDIDSLPSPAPADDFHPGSPYGQKSYSVSAPQPPASDQTKIYRDNYGTRIINTNSSARTANPDYNQWISNSRRYLYTYTHKYYAYPSLADISFYFWSKDLQSEIANKVIPKIRKTGTETFTSGNKSVTFDEYWNPKNDPAEWQHLTQYTIGYGTAAGKLPKVTNTSPQWGGGTFDMYGTGFSNLATGTTTWDDVTTNEADKDNTSTGYDAVRPQDMWHMAINSRGKFYPVSGGDLSGVFADIFDDIVVDNAIPISGFTSASGSVSRVGTQSYQTSYIATEDASSNIDRWHGHVSSDYIATSGVSTPNPAWGVNSSGKHLTTADKLDTRSSSIDLNNRLILTYDRYATTPQGVSFKWNNLSNPTTGVSQRMWLNKGVIGDNTTRNGDGKGENRLNFIRGDRSKELGKTNGEFRKRKSSQGDIVNSAIWYTGAPSNGHAEASYKTFANTHRGRIPMIYVGGNDGMLHGFSAKDGSEKIAYIPHGVVQNLSLLADPLYGHRYYVDGSPFSGDVNLGSETTPNWQTYLFGTLGAGGRGYFILNVTKPGPDSDFKSTPTASASDFTETNAANLIVMDKTAAALSDATPPSKPVDVNAHPDIGHIFGQPVVSDSNMQRALQVTRTNNNGRWALITGNGYNSENGRPVLLIQYLDGTKNLKTIPAVEISSPEANSNGLSTPQFLDVNGDGTPDFVYAGDLRGNIWKFDISAASDSNWGVAFSGNPLFTATYSSDSGSSSRQPITAPPVLRPNRTVGGLMVAFGTGQNLTEGDRSDTSVQSIYSVLDNTRYEIESDPESNNKGKVKIKGSNPAPATVGSRSNLQAESITDGTGNGTAGAGASTGRSFWKLSSTEVNYSCLNSSANCTPKKGWYMDLPVAGERVTTSFDFYDGSNLLEIISEKPASGSATASGEEVCAPQPQAAKPFRTLINITSGLAPTPPVMDVNGDGFYTAAVDGEYARMSASSKELRFSTRDKQIRKGNDGKEDKLAKLPELMLRPNWRQLK